MKKRVNLTAICATRCEENVEIVFAIFSTLEFVEYAVGEWPKTLSATEKKSIN